MRTEVGDRDPGQDEEPRVVNDQGEVLLAQLWRPWAEPVGRSAEDQIQRGSADTAVSGRMDGVSVDGANASDIASGACGLHPGGRRLPPRLTHARPAKPPMALWAYACFRLGLGVAMK